MNDQQYFCPAGGNSCYFYSSTSQTYALGKTTCQNRGGYAVSYNSGRAPRQTVHASLLTAHLVQSLL